MKLPGLNEAPQSSGDEHTGYDGHGTTMGLLIAGTGKANGGNGTFGLAPLSNSPWSTARASSARVVRARTSCAVRTGW